MCKLKAAGCWSKQVCCANVLIQYQHGKCEYDTSLKSIGHNASIMDSVNKNIRRPHWSRNEDISTNSSHRQTCEFVFFNDRILYDPWIILLTIWGPSIHCLNEIDHRHPRQNRNEKGDSENGQSLSSAWMQVEFVKTEIIRPYFEYQTASAGVPFTAYTMHIRR